MTKQSWMGGSIQISFKQKNGFDRNESMKEVDGHLRMMNDGDDRW